MSITYREWTHAPTDMKRFIFVIFVIVTTFVSPGKSYREEIEQLFNKTYTNMTDELRKNLEVVKNSSAPKGIQDIFHYKGEEFKKLEETFTKKSKDEFKKKLGDVNYTVKARIQAEMGKVHDIFVENFDRYRDVAAAEHYREVKPFYDFVCAIRLIDNTLEEVWHKNKYGGMSRAKELMTELNKKEAYRRDSEESLPSCHRQFSDCVVPGEKLNDVGKFYQRCSLYVTYELHELATKVRQELESIRGRRRIEDVIAEFAYVLAKLVPFAKFVHRKVIADIRKLAQENYRKQLPMSPFLDELPKLMPNKKWYFPPQYLHYFNVLGRALGLRDLETREYRRDNVTTLLPVSDQCMQRPDDHVLYQYVNMYFSTTPKLTVMNV